jgi:sec-independent protein translocase protein TatC
MKQTFLEHVHELRTRLAVSVGVLIVGAALAYAWRDQVLGWLQAPLHANLYYSDVMGAFSYLMQACLLVGLLLAVPVVVYNLIAFVRPALPRPVTRGQVAGLVAISYGLCLGGAAFAYYASLPLVLHFLSSVDISHLHPLIAAGSYLSFVIAYLAVFAIVFQLPLILLFIDRVTPIPPSTLKRWRKWVIIGAFGAAIILPIVPDPVSQITLALPIVILYEISLWLVVLAHRRRTPRRAPLPPRAQPARTPVHQRQAVPQPLPRPRRPVMRPVYDMAPTRPQPVVRPTKPAMKPVNDRTVGRHSQVIDMRPSAQPQPGRVRYSS